MEDYISKNFYKKTMEVKCISGETYKGIVGLVVEGLLGLDQEEERLYIAISKIVSFKILD
ncbi:MAG: hypothetical protein AB1782_17510 [Cyanobacteriota bacterium]